MIVKELVNLVVENDTLEEKLLNLQNAKKKKIGNSRPFISNPFTTQKFMKPSSYQVGSKINIDLPSEEIKRKIEDREKTKEFYELNDCTFKPRLNQNSLRIIKSKPPLRTYKNNIPTQTQNKPIKITQNITSVQKYKLDPNFYYKQLNSRKLINGKLESLSNINSNEKPDYSPFKNSLPQKNTTSKHIKQKISSITDTNIVNFSEHHCNNKNIVLSQPGKQIKK